MAFEELPSTGAGAAEAGRVVRASWGEQARLNFNDHEERIQDLEAVSAAVWRGDWAVDTAYNAGDIVQHNGSSWRASEEIPIQSPDVEPGETSPDPWTLVAAAAGAGTLLLDELLDVVIGSPLSDGDVLTYDSGGQLWINSPPASAQPTTYVRKTSDETVTSSDVPQNDDELVAALEANSVYEVRYSLVYQAGTTGDFRWQWQGPSDIVGVETAMRLSNSAASSEGNLRGSATSAFTSGAGGVLSAGGTAANAGVQGHMLLVTTTAGNLQLTWSQETSNGTGTIVRTGSFMVLQKLA